MFEVSVGLHGKDALEREVTVDTTVQEKNITFPTDVKLLTKGIRGCRALAEAEGLHLRRSFRRELPGLPRQRHKTRKTIRRVRTMAGTLIRELVRKLPSQALSRHGEQLDLYRRVQTQKRKDKNKVYSLHEPGVLCIARARSTRSTNSGPRPPASGPRRPE